MGGQMEFAPTLIREIQKSLKSVIQNLTLIAPKTKRGKPF
jgi:hypothetical protein